MKIYIIKQIHFEYNDEYYYPTQDNETAGTSIIAYKDKKYAKEVLKEKQLEEIEKTDLDDLLSFVITEDDQDSIVESFNKKYKTNLQHIHELCDLEDSKQIKFAKKLIGKFITFYTIEEIELEE